MAKNDDEPTTVEPKGWEDDWQLAFQSDYLGAPHLRGMEVTLVISRVRLPELKMVKPGMRPQKKRKLVIEFDALKGRSDGMPYQWIVNKTNADVIATLYGPAPRDWVGKRITIWPDPNVDQPSRDGKRHIKGPAIRVRPKVAERTQQRAARGDALPPQAQESPPPAAGPMSEEEMQEIARREAEEEG
jgi:hypothetical protein